MRKFNARAREIAIKRYHEDTPTKFLTDKDKKWIRYLWLVGVSWREIRYLYGVRDETLLAIIKMPENWESLAA